MLNKRPGPIESAAAVSARDGALLPLQIDAARAELAQLQQQIFEARADLRRREASQLVEANEQLVLAMLRVQADAEAAKRDIAFRELTTELRLKGQRLGEENRQLSETSRLKSQFLANMSHELRTPLNAIIGFTDLIRSGVVTERSPKYLEFLGHIGTSGRHLLQLINDVLDVAKVEAGKLEFHPEPVDLGQVVAEVIEMVQAAPGGNAVVVETQIESNLGGLVLDRLRLKQVLCNLLSNAIKFSQPGSTVTVRGLAEGEDSVRVEVEDSGIGITADEQAHLFVEFHQVDRSSTRKHEGTGLGLALARLLVEAQGGSVGVRSAPGVGSVFHFVLRRDARAMPATPPPAPSSVAQLRLDLQAADPARQINEPFAPLDREDRMGDA